MPPKRTSRKRQQTPSGDDPSSSVTGSGLLGGPSVKSKPSNLPSEYSTAYGSPVAFPPIKRQPKTSKQEGGLVQRIDEIIHERARSTGSPAGSFQNTSPDPLSDDFPPAASERDFSGAEAEETPSEAAAPEPEAQTQGRAARNKSKTPPPQKDPAKRNSRAKSTEATTPTAKKTQPKAASAKKTVSQTPKTDKTAARGRSKQQNQDEDELVAESQSEDIQRSIEVEEVEMADTASKTASKSPAKAQPKRLQSTEPQNEAKNPAPAPAPAPRRSKRARQPTQRASSTITESQDEPEADTRLTKKRRPSPEEPAAGTKPPIPTVHISPPEAEGASSITEQPTRKSPTPARGTAMASSSSDFDPFLEIEAPARQNVSQDTTSQARKRDDAAAMPPPSAATPPELHAIRSIRAGMRRKGAAATGAQSSTNPTSDPTSLAAIRARMQQHALSMLAQQSGNTPDPAPETPRGGKIGMLPPRWDTPHGTEQDVATSAAASFGDQESLYGGAVIGGAPDSIRMTGSTPAAPKSPAGRLSSLFQESPSSGLGQAASTGAISAPASEAQLPSLPVVPEAPEAEPERPSVRFTPAPLRPTLPIPSTPTSTSDSGEPFQVRRNPFSKLPRSGMNSRPQARPPTPYKTRVNAPEDDDEDDDDDDDSDESDKSAKKKNDTGDSQPALRRRVPEDRPRTNPDVADEAFARNSGYKPTKQSIFGRAIPPSDDILQRDTGSAESSPTFRNPYDDADRATAAPNGNVAEVLESIPARFRQRNSAGAPGGAENPRDGWLTRASRFFAQAYREKLVPLILLVSFILFLLWCSIPAKDTAYNSVFGDNDVESRTWVPELKWYGWSGLSYNVGQLVPLYLAKPFTIFSSNITVEYERRIRDAEYQLMQMDSNVGHHAASIKKLEKVLPQVIHMDLEPSGRPKVNKAFYYALRDLMKQDREVLTLGQDANGDYNFISDEHWNAITSRLDKDGRYGGATSNKGISDEQWNQIKSKLDQDGRYHAPDSEQLKDHISDQQWLEIKSRLEKETDSQSATSISDAQVRGMIQDMFSQQIENMVESKMPDLSSMSKAQMNDALRHLEMKVEQSVKNKVPVVWADWVKSNKKKVEEMLAPYVSTASAEGAENTSVGLADKVVSSVRKKYDDVVNSISEGGQQQDDAGVLMSREDFLSHFEKEFVARKQQMMPEIQGILQSDLKTYIDKTIAAVRFTEKPEAINAKFRAEVLTLVERRVQEVMGNIGVSNFANSQISKSWESDLRNRINYFSHGAGATIDPHHTSSTHMGGGGQFQKFSKQWRDANRLPVGHRPSVSLDSWEEMGQCWCGSIVASPIKKLPDGRTINLPDGVHLSVNMGYSIIPDFLVLEHILPGETVMPNAAPKDVEVWAYVEELNTRNSAVAAAVELFADERVPDSYHNPYSEGWVKVGQFEYDPSPNQDGVYIYKIPAKFQEMRMSTDHITLRAISNQGHEKQTCIYRVRMYGENAEM